MGKQMVECPNPQCEERINGKIEHYNALLKEDIKDHTETLFDEGGAIRFISKKAVLIALTVIVIPLIITGIKVWSGQEHDYLRYASKDQFADCQKGLDGVLINQRYFAQHLDELKGDRKEQAETLKKIFQKLHDIELRLPRTLE